MTVRLLHGDCRVLKTARRDTRIKKGQRLSPATEFKPGQHWRQHGLHRERNWLLAEYVGKGRSAGDIAKDLGFTDGTVFFWLHKHGIPRRSISNARAIKHWGTSGADNPMFGKVGCANPNYIDGSSPERQRWYAQAAGRAFLRNVYKRDGYRCVRCGEPKGKSRSLHPHHIVPWAGNEALRFEIANAITLCRVCHSWVHSKANEEREHLA